MVIDMLLRTQHIKKLSRLFNSGSMKASSLIDTVAYLILYLKCGALA